MNEITIYLTINLNKELLITTNFNGNKDWSISNSYQSLQELDVKIDSCCQYNKHILFPIIDKKLMKYLIKCLTKKLNNKLKDNQVTFINNFTSAFEDYIHSILQFQHLYPNEIRGLVIQMFSLQIMKEETITNVNSIDYSLDALLNLIKSKKTINVLKAQKLMLDFIINENRLVNVSITRGKKEKLKQIEYEVKFEFQSQDESNDIKLSRYYNYDDFLRLYNNLKHIAIVDMHSIKWKANREIINLSTISSKTSSVDNILTSDKLFMLSRFPKQSLKNKLGISLNEKDLTYRTKLLDRWIREIFSKYYILNNQSRQIIFDFFYFDLSVDNHDIIIYNKIVNGLVYNQRAEMLSTYSYNQLIESSEAVNNFDTIIKIHNSKSRNSPDYFLSLNVQNDVNVKLLDISSFSSKRKLPSNDKNRLLSIGLK